MQWFRGRATNVKAVNVESFNERTVTIWPWPDHNKYRFTKPRIDAKHIMGFFPTEAEAHEFRVACLKKLVKGAKTRLANYKYRLNKAEQALAEMKATSNG
jgi:hypothetical protein